MTTYSNAPTGTWNQPVWSALGVLATLVAVLGVGWFLLRSDPAVLTPGDIDGDWPFAAAQVEVHCRATAASAVVDGTAYALSPELRSAPDLATFDLAADDGVWLERPNGTKVPLQPVIDAAEARCR